MDVWGKLRVTWTALVQVLRGLMRDFGGYYLSPYPILLIIGAWSRLVRRLIRAAAVDRTPAAGSVQRAHAQQGVAGVATGMSLSSRVSRRDLGTDGRDAARTVTRGPNAAPVCNARNRCSAFGVRRPDRRPLSPQASAGLRSSGGCRRTVNGCRPYKSLNSRNPTSSEQF